MRLMVDETREVIIVWCGKRKEVSTNDRAENKNTRLNV